jgi:hypothetical protein
VHLRNSNIDQEAVMIISLLSRREAPHDRKFKGLAHPEYPIEQTLRANDGAMHTLLLRASRRLRNAMDDARYLAGSRGVRVLGRSEGALRHATATLSGRHATRVTVEPPCIRYAHGAQVLEPWMDVLVNVPERYGNLVQENFEERRGTLRRLDRHGGAIVLEGEAPLACLLGYADWLRDLTEDEPNVATWLSRYLPLDRGPHA